MGSFIPMQEKATGHNAGGPTELWILQRVNCPRYEWTSRLVQGHLSTTDDPRGAIAAVTVPCAGLYRMLSQDPV